MSKTTSTGAKFHAVSGKPATFDKAGYEALSWVEVGEVIDIPEYGPDVTVVESQPLATGITEKYSGFINYGSLSLGLEFDDADTGQTVLSDAIVAGSDFVPHSFRIDFPNGKSEYFHGGVFSYTRNIGTANSMVGSTVNIEINSPILRETSPV